MKVNGTAVIFNIYFISCCISTNALIQSTAKQTTTVDHADIRGLVTDLPSLRRGACLSLVAGIMAS